MQIKVACHIKSKKTTENGCIFSILNISIDIWSRGTKLFFLPIIRSLNIQ